MRTYDDSLVHVQVRSTENDDECEVGYKVEVEDTTGDPVVMGRIFRTGEALGVSNSFRNIALESHA